MTLGCCGWTQNERSWRETPPSWLSFEGPREGWQGQAQKTLGYSVLGSPAGGQSLKKRWHMGGCGVCGLKGDQGPKSSCLDHGGQARHSWVSLQEGKHLGKLTE